jgi:hypothetical protein
MLKFMYMLIYPFGANFRILPKKIFTSAKANKSESRKAVGLVAATTWTNKTVNRGASRGSSLFSQVHCPQQHIVAFKNSALPQPLMASRGSKSYPQLVSLLALSFGVQVPQFESNYNDPDTATNLLCRRVLTWPYPSAPVDTSYWGTGRLWGINT